MICSVDCGFFTSVYLQIHDFCLSLFQDYLLSTWVNHLIRSLELHPYPPLSLRHATLSQVALVDPFSCTVTLVQENIVFIERT